MAKTRLTAEKYDELKAELKYLKEHRVDEVATLLKEARAFGDLSENSEYDEARNEQGKLYSRIAELENILSNCTVINEEDTATDVVRIGSKITVEDVEMGFEETYHVVGSQEADPMNGRISEESPFGKALLGAKEGQQVTVEAPRGAIVYTLKRIER